MPIFISYSHQDREFVEDLATHLIKARAHVWVDRWELKVGESILTRVQDAIAGASALLVILSKASVASEWCRKELNAGLIRELEERRVVVLPVLMEDCEVPLFLRDKMYADFRSNYDEGVQQILESVARVTTDTQGRIENPTYDVDWAVDWFDIDDRFHLRYTMIERATEQPFTVLTEIVIEANDVATRRYRQFEEAGLDWFGRQMVFEFLAELQGEDFFLMLDDQFPQVKELVTLDPKFGLGYEVTIVCRRLGEDTGKSVLMNVRARLEAIREAQRSTIRQPTPEEKERLIKIVTSPVRQ
jgi:hypothetical protein